MSDGELAERLAERLKSGKLSDKQQRFVDEYLVDLNAVQAALRAGYSPKSAKQANTNLRDRPAVFDAIMRAIKERKKRMEITQDSVLNEIARVAFGDPRKLFQADGSLLHIQDLDDDTAATISGFDMMFLNDKDTKDGPIYKPRLCDKLTALDKLAKHLGLIPDRKEITGKDGGDIGVRLRHEVVLVDPSGDEQ